MTFLLGDNTKFGETSYGGATDITSNIHIGDSVPDTGTNICYFYNKLEDNRDIYDIDNISFEYNNNYFQEIKDVTISQYNSLNQYRYDVLLTNNIYNEDGTITPLYKVYECRQYIKLITVPTNNKDLRKLVRITNKFGFKENIRYNVELIHTPIYYYSDGYISESSSEVGHGSLSSSDQYIYKIKIYNNINSGRYNVEYTKYDIVAKKFYPNNTETINPQRVYFLVESNPGDYEYSYSYDSNGHIKLNTYNMNEYVYLKEGASLYIEEPTDPIINNKPLFPMIHIGVFNDGNFRIDHDEFSKYSNSRFPVRKLNKFRCKILSSNTIKIPFKPVIRNDLGYDVALYCNDTDITDSIKDVDILNMTIKLDYYPLLGHERVEVSMYYIDEFVKYNGFFSNHNDFISLNINPRYSNYFSNIFDLYDNENAPANMMTRTLELIDGKVITLYLKDDGSIFHTIQKSNILSISSPYENCFDSFSYNNIIIPSYYSNYQSNDAVVLGTISIPNKFSKTTILDSRKRGGGINYNPTSDGMWWDWKSFDGESYTQNGVFIVKSSSLKDRHDYILKSVNKFKAAGSFPVYLEEIEKQDSEEYVTNNHNILYDSSVNINTTPIYFINKYIISTKGENLNIKYKSYINNYDSIIIYVDDILDGSSDTIVINSYDDSIVSCTVDEVGIYKIKLLVFKDNDIIGECSCVVKVIE